MKTFSLLVLTALLVLASCSKLDIASDTPGCIAKEIKDNKNNADWYVGQVIEYEFQGKLVYSFDPDTERIADGSSTIKDANCNTLCHVGGFAGPANNQCLGENFFQNAVLKRTIWKKK